MDRPSSVVRTLIPLALLLALIAGACGGSDEDRIISNYFRAARMGDNTTLGNIAVVSFNAQEDGVVRDFTITNVQEERRALRVKEMLAASDAAQAAQDTFSDEMKAYQDENIEAIDRVLQAERAGGDVARGDQEVAEAWRNWRDQMAEHSKKVADARTALSDERGIAEVSLMNPQNQVDVSQYDGELVTKNVSIDAQVDTPDGQSIEKAMVVQMQRAELMDGENTITGRWIITSIEDA